MKRFRWAAFLTIPFLLLLASCGEKNVGELTETDKQAFGNAPPEVGQMWLAALEASKTNDYAGAQTLLYSLLNQNLSPAQRQVVIKESNSVNQRLSEGVAKGDPDALKAVEEMRRNPPGRPPH